MDEYKYVSDDKELEGWNQIFTSRFGDGLGDSEDDYLSTLELVVRLKPRAALLDIGSGLGRIIELVKFKVPRVIGLEPDAERFHACHRGNHDGDRVQIFRCSSDEYIKRNPEARFDVIVVSMVVQHVPTFVCDRIFSDVHSLLADDGVAVIATTHFPEERFACQLDAAPQSRENFDAYASDSAKQTLGIPVRQFSRSSFIAALAKAGLCPVHWRQFSYIRPEKLDWWATEMKISPDSLRNVAASQFAIVRRA